uniref:Uncharacterized protein n=1 Tax=Pithovirus LCPAC104 TaxID=2506589 RepID=A0A481Z697_9VIRU|nr:MAG: hypothetical protein LCPAC104_01460 [Pithovirus LCPAC104]
MNNESIEISYYLIVFIILTVIVLIAIILAIKDVMLDRDGKIISLERKIHAYIISIFLILIFSLIYIYWLYGRSREWEIVIIITIILIPLLIAIFVGLIAGNIINVGFIFETESPKINNREKFLAFGTDKSQFL